MTRTEPFGRRLAISAGLPRIPRLLSIAPRNACAVHAPPGGAAIQWTSPFAATAICWHSVVLPEPRWPVTSTERRLPRSPAIVAIPAFTLSSRPTKNDSLMLTCPVNRLR